MNGSFILLGLSMIIGSIIYFRLSEKFITKLGFMLFIVGGCGVILVGLFPENYSSSLHEFGAALPFLVGNIALVLISIKLTIFKQYTFIMGFFALIALFFYFMKIDLGIGAGGMERLVAYPQTVWMIVFGIYIIFYLSKNNIKTFILDKK